MRWRAFLVIGATAFVARAVFAADKEDEAREAVLVVDPGCSGRQSEVHVEPSGPGFVACCDKKDVMRFYFVTLHGRKAHVTRLFDHRGDVNYRVRAQSLNLEYEAGGNRHEMSWYLGRSKPELPDEIERGETVCPKERYRDHYNGVAESLQRPTRTADFHTHRVTVEHEVIVCRDGLRRIASSTGLLIPLKVSLEVGPLGLDVFVPVNRSNPGHVSFTVAARVAAKSLTLQLQPRDDSKNPIVGGDARTGDHFEIWIAPPAPEPTCDELLKMTPLCTAPAVVALPVRIWIGQAADGKLSVATEPRDVAASVAVKSDGAMITVELGGGLPGSAAEGGLAVLYHDQASGATIGTANPEKGNFSLLGEAAVLPPPMEERTVPLK